MSADLLFNLIGHKEGHGEQAKTQKIRQTHEVRIHWCCYQWSRQSPRMGEPDRRGRTTTANTYSSGRQGSPSRQGSPLRCGSSPAQEESLCPPVVLARPVIGGNCSSRRDSGCRKTVFRSRSAQRSIRCHSTRQRRSPGPGSVGQSAAHPVATVTINATTTAPVWTDDATISEVERAIHTWINIERTIPRDGSFLRWDDDLAAVARAHSEDMATRNYLDHDTPEGLDPTDRLHAAGLSCRKGNSYGIAENIAIETSLDTMDEAAFESVKGWVGSPGHKRNLLNDEYDKTGVGAALGTWQGRKALYLTQVFC